MGRYGSGSDQEISQSRIEQAKRKHGNKLKSKESLYPRNKICTIPFDSTVYGERIRNVRKAKGLTAEELANNIGTTIATLSKMENGHIKSLNWDFLYLICAVCNTNPYFLLGKTLDYSEAVTMDKDGNIRSTFEPLSFTEQTPVLLADELSMDSYAIANQTYRKNPDLCKLLLYVLQHRNSDMQSRLDAALRGICAVYLSAKEWQQLKLVKDGAGNLNDRGELLLDGDQ